MTEDPTLRTVFERERDSLEAMLATLEDVMQDTQPAHTHYAEMQKERVKMEQTLLYLEDRLNGDVPCKFLV